MRTRLMGIAASAALLIAAAAGSAQAATALDASWTSSCGATTCFNDKGVYTQTFSASAFSGPVTVGQLLMDRGVLGDFVSETFRISFELNGEELGTWGKFNMAGIAGDELSFEGLNFTWNPEDGDLVLVLAIVWPEKGGAGGGGFLRAPLEEPLPNEGDEDPAGTVPQAPAPVPEPSAWALMITGFGLAGAVARRRRTVFLAQPER